MKKNLAILVFSVAGFACNTTHNPNKESTPNHHNKSFDEVVLFDLTTNIKEGNIIASIDPTSQDEQFFDVSKTIIVSKEAIENYTGTSEKKAAKVKRSYEDKNNNQKYDEGEQVLEYKLVEFYDYDDEGVVLESE